MKPNILYVFADQMRGDCLGHDGGVISPHLDRLAAEGVTFTNCQSNSPLCVPARTALMTGQLIRETGIWSNRSGADEHGQSHVRNVRDAGYRTAVIGKTHLWRHGSAGRHGVHVAEMEHNLKAWGFDDCIEINDPIETAWMDCHYTDDLKQKGLLDEHRTFILHWVAEDYETGNPKPWNQVPAPVPAGEDIDSFVGRRASEWLQGYTYDQPFYLQVQFTGPHDPFDGPTSYRDRYDPASIDPGIEPRDHPRLPRNISARWERARSVHQATTAERQQWRVNYYANITLIDDWIGKILDVLSRQGQLDNTWVIFTSDHGEMLGDHGLWSKAVWYKQSVHVPCLVRPARGMLANHVGWRSSALTEHIDVPATIVDIAGATPLRDSTGASLARFCALPSSDRTATVGKSAVLSELFGETTLITDQFKLTVRTEDNKARQFFDLALDPDEHENRVLESTAADTIETLTREYLTPALDRLNNEQLADYRDYVARTGRIN